MCAFYFFLQSSTCAPCYSIKIYVSVYVCMYVCVCTGVLFIGPWWLVILCLLPAPQQIWTAELVTGSGRVKWIRLVHSVHSILAAL